MSRPVSLTLKGFKGIRSGLGRDEVTIDFSGLRGLIALVGDNGRGKSTVLNNMHHYRIMPDRVKKYTVRSFSFFEETYGSDAKKEFVSELDGELFRSVLLIDANKRKQEAYLYRKNAAGLWEVHGNTQDGKLEVFDAAVEELSGTPRMFFTSISRSQKAPSLSSYTRGEMMDIFSELINVDDHKEKKETAGDVADALLAKRSLLVQEKASLEFIVKDAESKNAGKRATEERLAAIAVEMSAIEEQLRGIEASVKETEIKVSLQGESLIRRGKLDADVVAKRARLEELAAAVAEKKLSYESAYAQKKTAKERVEARLPVLTEEISTTEAQLRNTEKSLRDLEVKESLQADASARKGKLEVDIAAKEAQTGALGKSLETKKVLYNQRHKAKRLECVESENLAKKAPDLEAKAAEEAARIDELARLKESLRIADDQLSGYGVRLREFASTETRIQEAEKTLQGLRLARKHRTELAENALLKARASAFVEFPCLGTENADICPAIKNAVSDKESLGRLEEELARAVAVDPQENILEQELAGLHEAVVPKVSVEAQEREAKELKESVSAEIKRVEQTLNALREDLKILPKVTDAKAALPKLNDELREVLEEGKSVIAEIEKQSAQLTAEIEALRAELAGIVVDVDLPAEIVRLRTSVESARANLEALRTEEASLRTELGSLMDIDALLKEGERAVSEIEKQMQGVSAELAALEVEAKAIEIDTALPEKLVALKESAEKERVSLERLRKEDAELRVSVGALAEALKRIEAARESLVSICATIEALDPDISEWQVLEKAMEGIMTLEIDDAGPTVTAITNDILHSCYGPRFSVNIKTQDAKVNGKAGDDMKEVFDIVVFDSERNESKSLSVMSGGEETWIDDAITRGISLFNANRGGKRYHALFSDEKDGRLTEQKRKEFMAVKRRVLELGKFDAEFFISHTREIQEMADAIIDLNALVSDEPSYTGAAADGGAAKDGVLV